MSDDSSSCASGQCGCKSSAAAPAVQGVANPGVLDAMAHDTRTDEIALIMFEPRKWDGSTTRLHQLEEKLNTYVSFAADGEMADMYPHLAGKPVRIQLQSTFLPDPRSEQFLDAARRELTTMGIRLELNHVPDPTSAGVPA